MYWSKLLDCLALAPAQCFRSAENFPAVTPPVDPAEPVLGFGGHNKAELQNQMMMCCFM